MKPIEVKNYYISTYRFGKDTGMAAHLLSYWIKKGYIPLESQVKIQRLTDGALKIDWDHVK